MPASSPITRQTVGKTFVVASSVLGAAALAQIGAITFALATKRPLPGPIVEMRVNPSPMTAAKITKPATFTLAPPTEALEVATPLLEPPTKAHEAATVMTAAIIPPLRPMPVIPEKLVQTPAPATREQELIEQGRTLRDRGDMNGALTKLREAQTVAPANPQVFAEIALTFEKMGLTDRAAEQWRKIYEMGESAGSYFIAADARLKQSQALTMMEAQKEAAAVGTGAPVSKANPEAVLGLGEIASVDVPDSGGGKKFVLRVPMKARAGAKVGVRDVVIHVLFYDQIGGKEVVETNANVTSRWANTPPDWAERDTEVLEVEYVQPRVDPREAGREDRKYFGYIVRLYYKGELQDERADPLRLAVQFAAPKTLEKDSQ